MPNGVSCAYFALRNGKKGIKEHNVFRGGIAGIQSVRTANAVASSEIASFEGLKVASPFLQKIAGFAKRLLYPLIIASGIYTTAKSNDKVKTGVSQASGIGTMYAFEQVAERVLKKVDSKVTKLGNSKKDKAIKVSWYILKGLNYATASMLGYTLGLKGATELIESYRNNLHKNKTQITELDNSNSVFDDIKS